MKESPRSILTWIGVGVLVVFSVIGVMWLADKASPSGASSTVRPEMTQVLESDRAKGPEDAKVVLVEYSDFECPACAIAAPIIKNILDEYASDVRFVYRHFPIPSHRNAEAAAYAAEAAGEQEKFFEMHDLLFERQDEWRGESNPTSRFIEYANLLGLDADRFGADMNSQKTKSKVSADKATAYSARINATPTFFVNGYPIVGIDPARIKNEIERFR